MRRGVVGMDMASSLCTWHRRYGRGTAGKDVATSPEGAASIEGRHGRQGVDVGVWTSPWASRRRLGRRGLAVDVRALMWASGHCLGRHRSLVWAGTITCSPTSSWGISTASWASERLQERPDAIRMGHLR